MTPVPGLQRGPPPRCSHVTEGVGELYIGFWSGCLLTVQVFKPLIPPLEHLVVVIRKQSFFRVNWTGKMKNLMEVMRAYAGMPIPIPSNSNTYIQKNMSLSIHTMGLEHIGYPPSPGLHNAKTSP